MSTAYARDGNHTISGVGYRASFIFHMHYIVCFLFRSERCTLAWALHVDVGRLNRRDLDSCQPDRKYRGYVYIFNYLHVSQSSIASFQYRIVSGVGPPGDQLIPGADLRVLFVYIYIYIYQFLRATHSWLIECARCTIHWIEMEPVIRISRMPDECTLVGIAYGVCCKPSELTWLHDQ